MDVHRGWERSGPREPLGARRRSVRVKLTALAAIAASLTALTGAAHPASAGAASHPIGAVETCLTQSGAGFPHAFTNRENLVTGPLALIGAGQLTPAATVREFGGNKFPLLVAAGHTVTIAVVGSTATLTYGDHSRTGHRVMTFRACRRRDAASTADGKPVTFWSGSVNVSQPGCVPLRIWVDRERRPRSAHIALGRRC